MVSLPLSLGEKECREEKRLLYTLNYVTWMNWLLFVLSGSANLRLLWVQSSYSAILLLFYIWRLNLYKIKDIFWKSTLFEHDLSPWHQVMNHSTEPWLWELEITLTILAITSHGLLARTQRLVALCVPQGKQIILQCPVLGASILCAILFGSLLACVVLGGCMRFGWTTCW